MSERTSTVDRERSGSSATRAPEGATLQRRRSATASPPVAAATAMPFANSIQMFADAVCAGLPVQRDGGGGVSSDTVQRAAAHGLSGAGGTLPHLGPIQRAFGRHDVSGVSAHVGGPAAEGASAMGARAYASGSAVAFASTPDLHLAAHEAAHVVQQRGGVQLSGGVGASGDVYEQHADAVADRVTRGESAEALLDQYAPSGATGGGVQRAVQRWADQPAEAVQNRHIVQSMITSANPAERQAIIAALSAPIESLGGVVLVRLPHSDRSIAIADLDIAPLVAEARRGASPSPPATPPAAPQSGVPNPTPASGDPAADAHAVQGVIADAARRGDAPALEAILDALRAGDASGRAHDAAAAASGDHATVTIAGTAYALRREDLAHLITAAERAVRTLPGAPATPGAVAEHLPPGLEVRSASASFTLPAGLVLSTNWQRTVHTVRATTARLTLTPEGFSIVLAPPVEIDAMFPASDQLLSGMSYNFATRRPTISVTEAGHGFAAVGAHEEAETTLTGMIQTALVGTRAGDAGYDPLHDVDLAGTARAIAGNLARMPTQSGTRSRATAFDAQQVGASATVASTSQVDVPAGGATVRIQAGQPITIDVQGAGSAGGVAAGGSPQGMANAAQFQSLTVSSQGIVILSNGQPVVRVQEIQLSRGGGVHVTRLELMGSAQAAADGEAVIRLLLGAMEVASHGVDDQTALGVASARGDGHAELVPGLTRGMLEQGISSAIQHALADHPTIGGVDIRQALGMSAP